MGIIIGPDKCKKQGFFIVLQRTAVDGNIVNCAVTVSKPFGMEYFFDVWDR